MEKLPYIRQRKRNSGLINDNTTSLANLAIPESILNDTPYPDIGLLGPAQKLTPEQVEKQRARGALRSHERAAKARDTLNNASKTKQDSISSMYSSRDAGEQDNNLKNQNVFVGPQQQRLRCYPGPGRPTNPAHLLYCQPPYITTTAVTPSTQSSHLQVWQQLQPNTEPGDPLPPGMNTLPQSILVPNTQPTVPTRPLAVGAPSWQPRQYSTTAQAIQPPPNTLPGASRHVGSSTCDQIQQRMQRNHLQGSKEQGEGRKRGAEDTRVHTSGNDNPLANERTGH